MPITKEILSMFEFSRNSKIALSIDNHFDVCTLSQHRSVPTEQKKTYEYDASISTHYKPCIASLLSLCGYTPSYISMSNASDLLRL